MAVQILHKRSAVEFKNTTGAQVDFGELALNYHESGPYLQCKDADGTVVQLGGVYINDSSPDNPLPGKWWLRQVDSALFLYDGNNWVQIAGGGGGGGGGGSTTIIGTDGIEATLSAADTYTIAVDLASDPHGLSIAGGKLTADIATTATLGTIKVGEGLDIAADGTLTVDNAESIQYGRALSLDAGTSPSTLNADIATASELGVVKVGDGIDVNAAGEISVSFPPSETYVGETPPASPVEGDLWWNSSDESGRLYVYYEDANSSQWVEASPQGETLTESEADGLYLSKVTNDTAAGEITFEGLTTHENGVKVTGGGTSIQKGIIGYDNDTIAIVASGEVKASFSSQDGVIRFNGDAATDQVATFASDRVNLGDAADGNSGFSITGDSFRTDSTQYNSVSVIDSPFGLNRANTAGVAVYSSYYCYPNNTNSFPSGAAADAEIYGFNANLGRLGGNAGSGAGKIKTAAAFYADDLNKDVGATSSGFHSNLSIGTNPDAINYNFYAAGDAPNYFAGQLFCSPNSLNVNFWNQFDRGFIKAYAGNNAIVSTGDRSYAPIQVSVGADFSTTKFLFSAQSGAGNGGSIVTATAGDLAFNNTSDYRVKTNVQNYSENASDKISALRLVSYTRTDFNVDIPIGFIAHELQEQIPEAVFGDKDKEVAIGTLTDYDGTELETAVVEPPAEELEYTEEVEATPYVAAVAATYDEEGNEVTAEVPEVEPTYTTVTRTKSWTPTGTQPVYQGVDQTKLIPLLTKALQEALERIEALEAAATA